MILAPDTSRLAAAVLVLSVASAGVPAVASDDPEDWEFGLRGPVEASQPGEDRAEPDEEVAAEDAPAPPQRPPPVADDPYAPLGIRMGTFTVFPSLELRGGYTDNADQHSDNRQASAYTRLMPELEFSSNWSRHALRGRAAASYRRLARGDDRSRATLDGELAGRIDLRTGVHADLRLSYRREPESRDDPNLPPGVAERVDVERLRFDTSLTRQVGRASLTMRGAVQQTDYDEDSLPELPPRSYRTEELGGRASYEFVEGTAVFLDAAANRRRYDGAEGSLGPQRGSRGYEVLAGLEMRLTGLLTGEAAVGYQRQTPDDPVFPVISGPAFRGALTWEPSALTTVRLEGAVSAEEASIDPLAAGARVSTADLTVTHAFRRNLIGSAGLGYSRSDYVGSPRRESSRRAGLGLEYLLSRELAIVAEAAHERHISSLPGENFTENRVELGLRVRR